MLLVDYYTYQKASELFGEELPRLLGFSLKVINTLLALVE